MKLKFFFFFLLSLYIVNCTFYIEAQATIRYVSKTGTSTPPYTSWETAATSIQLCINVCVNGDTIYVANGVYKENLVVYSISLNLFGTSIDSTIIDGTSLSNTTVFFNYAISTIEGFNIIGAGLGIPSRGIILKNLPLVVKNCRISNAETGIGTIGSAAGIFAYNLILIDVGWGSPLLIIATT